MPRVSLFSSGCLDNWVLRQRSQNAERWEKGVRLQAFSEILGGGTPWDAGCCTNCKAGEVHGISCFAQYERVIKETVKIRTFSPFVLVKKLISIFTIFCNHYGNSKFSLGIVLYPKSLTSQGTRSGP